MTRRFAAAPWWFAAALASTALAAPATPTSPLLSPATTSEFRAAMLGRADSAGTSQDAGEAWYLRGRSFWRGGQKDSAVANFRRAATARGSHQDRLALADALLIRRASGDPTEVVSLLLPLLPTLGGEDPRVHARYQARLGWADQLMGRTPQAMERFEPIQDMLLADPSWRLRYANVLLDTGDYRRAYDVITPLVLSSRRKDKDVVALLDRIGTMSGAGARLNTELDRRLYTRDGAEDASMRALDGRRVRFQASDGEAIAGYVFPPPKGRPRAALVLMAPGDSLADYDSLVVSLRRGGMVVMLIEPRGTGHSVSAAVPGPETWDGREDALVLRVARDVRDALSELQRQTPLDTTRAAIVAVGASAPIALQAVEQDPRLMAVALVSPVVDVVDRPAMLERAARLKPPVFIQSSPAEFEQREFVETLLHTTDERASRSVEARSFGGAAQFRYDATLGKRITDWIAATLSARRPSTSGTPRSTPRRG